MSRSWMRLDNAALIFPAVSSSRWANTFRLSADLKDPVDPAVLQQAVEDLMPRFPSYYQRLGTGFFWYFLEDVKEAPRVRPEYAWPLTHMSAREQGRCCFRVLYHGNRVAVEFFHVLTDGTGGLIYLKNLLAQYIRLRYDEEVPCGGDILSLAEEPRELELSDAFQRCTGRYPLSRQEATAYRLRGRPDPRGGTHVITGIVKTEDLKAAADARGATVTALLSALMTDTITEIQAAHVSRKKWKPVKITVPVNLRKIFHTETLRNFSLVLNVGVDPRLKDYLLEDLCREYREQMALESAPEKMAGRIAANVLPQRAMGIRIAPLFIKNIVMRLIYRDIGERKGCINISNMGRVDLPAEMERFVRRMDFMIGVQHTYPNNCSVVSCGGVTCINMVRNIQETELERRFFGRLVRMGIPVLIESGDAEQER
ncbi:MAG: hypothetical protein IJK77_08125 [Lachnospiraceae bacterium]|nr:hypothetical protein [Lachnospiraceae bacterium]